MIDSLVSKVSLVECITSLDYHNPLGWRDY
jgi:hypothetical protein